MNLAKHQAAQLERLVKALTEIADADYRGNRSQESEIAHRALVAEGFRPTTPKPCTCTIACIPTGLADGQVCRLR